MNEHFAKTFVISSESKAKFDFLTSHILAAILTADLKARPQFWFCILTAVFIKVALNLRFEF